MLRQKISIHALREEGDPLRRYCKKTKRISIHALREEGDLAYPKEYELVMRFLSTPSARRATHTCHPPHLCIAQFLSTPSARRATCISPRCVQLGTISIHALREEGD